MKTQMLKALSLGAVISMLISPAGAYADFKTAEGLGAKENFNIDLEWEYSNGDKLLSTMPTPEGVARYSYDSDNNRVKKVVDEKVTIFEYNDCGQIVSEYRDNKSIFYQYETVEELGDFLDGFTLNGQQYYFQKDENQTVTAILDSYGSTVATYEYKDGIVYQVFGLDSNGEWVDKSDDPNFIGNLNMIRLYSYYYDSESGLYYSDRYYDSVHERFVDGTDEVAYELIPSSTYSLSRDVDNEVNRLLNSSNYGKPLSYTSTWYNSLTTTELLARLIFAENTSYEPDQNAIGYCLLNRYHGNDGYHNYYGDTMKEIATKSSQFSVITGGKDSSINARQPKTSSDGWKHATYIAVSIVLFDNDISECENLFYRPEYMDYQTQFVSWSYFMKNSTNGNGCIKYKNKEVKDVIIPDVGTYTTKETLDWDYRNAFKGESNIHFGYK